MNSAPQFTAAQIASALGKTRQAAQRALAGVAPTGTVIVGGNPANAWGFSALPAAIQNELNAKATRLGYRSTENLLNSPGQRWQSSIPLAAVAQSSVDKAAKLQRALRRMIELRDNTLLSAAERERIGLDDYAREFGHTITDRYLRGLVKRTVDRDGGAGEFERLEIYLDEQPEQKQPAKPVIPLAAQSEFSELLAVMATFRNPAQPKDAEEDYLWLRAFELEEEKIETGRKAKKVRGSLLKFLWRNAPFLAKNSNALRVAYRFKYNRWLAAERKVSALADGRGQNSGFHRAPELSQQDRDALIAHARFNCGGRVSQAWRELCERRELTEELLGHYLSNPESKSYCPKRIRDSVKYEIEMMDDIHHGPRTDKLNGAHLSRDWSNVSSMDWLCADDATLEVYFYIPDGKGWFTLTRGQLLLMIDSRSTRILGYALLPEKSYNAPAIRTLITKTCDEHGLPHKGFLFEGGIWKNARLLKGDQSDTPFSLSEAELGLRSLGLKFVHSRLPRSKPVERVLGALQDLMDGEPGFVGGNEMAEKFERVQRHKLDVVAKKFHPSKHFYDQGQWDARLDELCERYNSDRQDGKMTGGLSPNEAFDKFSRVSDSVVFLPPACRYLLSHHKRPVKVTNNGITLRFGKHAFNYRDEQTGKLRGQTVLAWFNPETPEILSVTDLQRQNPICVARANDVPAMDAPADLLAEEMEKLNGHLSYARTRYRILKARFPAPVRPNRVALETAQLGVDMAQKENKLLAAKSDEQRRETRGRKAARGLNMAVSSHVARRPETAPALERLSELLNEEESK